jgi:hypothetical protein
MPDPVTEPSPAYALAEAADIIRERMDELSQRKRLDPLGAAPEEVDLKVDQLTWAGPDPTTGKQVQWVQNYVEASVELSVGNEMELTVSCRYPITEDHDDTDKRIFARQAVGNVSQAVQAVLGGTPWKFDKNSS